LNEREQRTFFGNPDPRKAHFFLGVLQRTDIRIAGETDNGSSEDCSTEAEGGEGYR
jgi:hypothetical protein